MTADEDILLRRLEEALLTGLRFVHEANLMVLGALGDSLPTPPLVDVVPAFPRFVDHTFRFAARLLEMQRRYAHEYLALLGGPEPDEERSAA